MVYNLLAAEVVSRKRKVSLFHLDCIPTSQPHPLVCMTEIIVFVTDMKCDRSGLEVISICKDLPIVKYVSNVNLINFLTDKEGTL